MSRIQQSFKSCSEIKNGAVGGGATAMLRVRRSRVGELVRVRSVAD